VLADGRTTALLAGRATAVVLADARTTALLAGRANAVVLAMPCGMLCCLSACSVDVPAADAYEGTGDKETFATSQWAAARAEGIPVCNYQSRFLQWR
jgi:hypothetical protein